MKKLLYFAAIAALVGGLFFACEDKTEDYGSPLALDKESIAATAAAASFEVAVTGKGAWEAESDAAWATLSPASGTGEGKVTISVAAATDTVERKATITVSSGYVHKEVVVTQAAQTNTALSIDRTTVNTSYAAISYPIVVTSDGDWSIESNQPWCVANPAKGSGSGTFKLDVELNEETVARTATVTVTGSGVTTTVAVTQGAYEVLFAIDRAETDIIKAWALDEVHTIQITGNDTWTVTSDRPWVTVGPVTSGAGILAVTLAIAENTSALNAPERNANVTFAGANSGRSYTIPVKQDAYYVPAPKGQWLFDDNSDLLKPEAGTTATLAYAKGGNSGTWQGAFTVIGSTIDPSGFSAVAGPSTNDGAIQVQKGYSLQCTHNIPIPNGLSSTKISEYTILWRVKYPSASTGYKPLLQTDITNGNGADYGGLTSHNDAEYWLNGQNFSGGVGAGTEPGGHQNRIVPDVWHNLMLVVNLGTGPGSTKFFLNGNLISQGQYDDANARAALESTFLFFADDSEGETTVWDCAELAIWDVAFDAPKAKAMQQTIDSRP